MESELKSGTINEEKLTDLLIKYYQAVATLVLFLAIKYLLVSS
jgi:hypothetical protein